MIIKQLKVKNYRTLEEIDVSFIGYYTAICGKNNVGKTNIIKAIQKILDSNNSIKFRFSETSMSIGSFDWNDEITGWKRESKEDISIDLAFEIRKEIDSAIYKFITDLIFKDEKSTTFDKIDLQVKLQKNVKNETKYTVLINGEDIGSEYQSIEILKRLQNTECLIFHNSTRENDFERFIRKTDRVKNFISSDNLETINKKQDELVKLVQKSLNFHQKELTDLLGNLEEKYEVSLSIQGINLEREQIEISLKEKGGALPLDDWGSGTRNRTLIFLNLLNAKRNQKSSIESDRFTPLVVIEEPESFLHPQAQAEFGRILQDLANTLQIQVIVTTHSPYLLSFDEPTSNILVERNTNLRSKKPSGSNIVETSGNKWFEPFALALGVNGEDFGPLKDLIFNKSSKILLVEGDTDREYFKLLQDEKHKDDALVKDIEIFPCDGADNIKNNILMKFIKSRFEKVVVCVDLDRYDEIKRVLEKNGFKDGIDMFPVGIENIQMIEGLIPGKLYNDIMRKNEDILDLSRTAAMAGKDHAKNAKKDLKKRILEEFKKEEIDNETYCEFYKLTKKLNKSLK
ncbi:MAG: ATP-binding protein [Methanosarcinales archaeon]|jgi:predicted ATP-dependent endonuclease of OLD family|nr:ATP-binding protein [Methanosarcinales archaeon]